MEFSRNKSKGQIYFLFATLLLFIFSVSSLVTIKFFTSDVDNTYAIVKNVYLKKYWYNIDLEYSDTSLNVINSTASVYGHRIKNFAVGEKVKVYFLVNSPEDFRLTPALKWTETVSGITLLVVIFVFYFLSWKSYKYEK